MLLKLFICFTLSVLCNSQNAEKPNIVFIVADDLGWGDVSYHGSNQIMTPNIDTLAYEGIILSDYYTDAHGTPSRSAIFTGKYPIRLGTQGKSIAAAEDRGIPLSEPMLPAILQDMGYATHLVGKWNLGKSREHYLPTNRGFDSFYGFLDSSVDYYTYNHVESSNDTVFYGLDFYENLNPVENLRGHLTDVLTDRAIELIQVHDKSTPLYLHVAHAAPHAGGGFANLQTPEEAIAANDHIAHSARRLYAGLVTGLDKSIGKIVKALAEREILQDTLIIFVSDNGAATTGGSKNFGSNLPLRGSKGTPWEGAVRSPAIIWHASLESKIWGGLFHVTDWLPTLITAAGGNWSGIIDGYNQWSAILKDEDAPRSDVLIAMDDLENWAALRDGDLKLIIGNVDEKLSNYYGAELNTWRLPAFAYSSVLLNSEVANVLKDTLNVELDPQVAAAKRYFANISAAENATTDNLCIPTTLKGCLYNISEDPTETNDLWDSSPEMVKEMALRLRVYWAQIKLKRESIPDPRANPALHNFVWFPWLENEEEEPAPIVTPPSFPMRPSMGEIQYLVNLNVNSFKDTFVQYFDSMAQILSKSVSDFFGY